jgi:hypothetical protein
MDEGDGGGGDNKDAGGSDVAVRIGKGSASEVVDEFGDNVAVGSSSSTQQSMAKSTEVESGRNVFVGGEAVRAAIGNPFEEEDEGVGVGRFAAVEDQDNYFPSVEEEDEGATKGKKRGGGGGEGKNGGGLEKRATQEEDEVEADQGDSSDKIRVVFGQGGAGASGSGSSGGVGDPVPSKEKEEDSDESRGWRWPQWRLFTLSAFTLGRSTMWAALLVVLIPLQVLEIAGDRYKGSVLGIVNFAASLLCAFVPPFIGALRYP